MRTKYLFLSYLLLTFALFLSNAFAQDYSQWDLPEGAIARIGKGTITDIAYSPDGSQLAVASLIGIWIYDARTGEELDLLTKHSSIYSVAYSPDGTTLATAGGTEVYLWDTDTRKYKTTLIAATKDMFFTISSIAYSPDGTTLATAGGTAAYLWNAETGEHKATLIEHAHGVNFLMYSPDGKTIATTIGDYTVFLWDADTRKRKFTLKGHTDIVYSVVYSPDGKTIATASRDHTVRLWDVKTGKNKKKIADDTGWGLSVAYSPDGNTLATAIGSVVRLWDANIENNLKTLKGHLYGSWGYIYSVVYSPDGKTIATASKGEVRLWGAETGKNKGTLKGHMYPADFVMYSPDGKTIATAIGSPHHRQHDEIISLWDAIIGVHKKDCKNSKKEVFGSVKSLTYSPDGKTIAVVMGSEVHFWDAETGKQHETILEGNAGSDTSMMYSPDGKTIAIASKDKVHLWNSETGKHKNTLKGHTKSITSVAYSPDGTTLASASGGEVYFWDLNTGEHINTLKGHTTTITSVTYSPDSTTLATTSRTGKGEVRLWDVNIGLWDVGGHISTLKGYVSFLYSPDGKTITTVSGTGEVHLWDTDMGSYKTILKYHSRGSPIVYSPDGKTIATASYDGTTILWDIRILVSQISQQPPMSIRGEALRGYVKQIGKDTMYRVQSIVNRDLRQDLALIKVSDVSSPVLPIGRSDKVQVGESVYVAGNPMGFLEGTFSDGVVSAVREFRVDSKRIQITAPISKGSSGGPVLNSKGEVIGVAVSTITAGQNLNFAIPSGYLSELLNKVKDQEMTTDNPLQEAGTLQTPQQIAKSALASTVLIVIEDTSGQILSTGSGFFVAPGIIATNLHVVKK